MSIVLISGSPRQAGNSEKILEKGDLFFKKHGYNINKIQLSTETTPPCIHCNFCSKNNHCNQDDNANQRNDLLKNAHAILVVSPVYFGGVTGQLKCLFDKTLPLRRNGFQLKGKIGAAITIGGSRNGGQELAIKNVHAWMLIHGMIIVGDNNHFGGTIHNPCNEDETGLKTANDTFSSVLDLLKRFKN